MSFSAFFHPLEYIKEALENKFEEVHPEEFLDYTILDDESSHFDHQSEIRKSHREFLNYPTETEINQDIPTEYNLDILTLTTHHSYSLNTTEKNVVPETKEAINTPTESKRTHLFSNLNFNTPFHWQHKGKVSQDQPHSDYAPENWKERALASEIREKFRKGRAKIAGIANRHNKKLKEGMKGM